MAPMSRGACRLFSKRARASALAFAALAWTSVASAQGDTAARDYPACDREPTQAESEAAHGAYIAGKGSFDEGDYPTAIRYFEDAYSRDCTKYELLNIIARAHELGGNLPQAIRALEVYLERAPKNDPENPAIEKRLATLRSRVGSSSAPPAGTDPPDEGAPIRELPPDAPPAEEGGGHTATPWIVAGVGAAVAVGGLALFVVGQNKVSTARSEASDLGCDIDTKVCQSGVPQSQIEEINDKQSSGNTLRNTGGVMVGIGAAAVVGGVVWHFLEPTKKSGSAFVPMVGPQQAGAVWSVRF